MKPTQESERRIRAALAWTAERAPLDNQQPSRLQDPRSPRRWSFAAAAMVAALAITGGALAMTTRDHPTRTLVQTPTNETIHIADHPYSIASTSSLATTTQPTNTIRTAEFTANDIPPQAGPDDWRSPIQRYLGVPLDMNDAAHWDFDHVQNGIAECMATKGYVYTKPLYGSDSTVSIPPGVDPETYNAALNGTFGPTADGSGCDRIASNEVHPVNVLPTITQEINALVYVVPAVVAATAGSVTCISEAGYPTGSNVPADVQKFCDEPVRVAINAAREDAEVTVMNAHYDFFVKFKSSLP